MAARESQAMTGEAAWPNGSAAAQSGLIAFRKRAT
jgi:hypothetical protein